VETLIAIAPTAIGRSKPSGTRSPAATGMATRLYPTDDRLTVAESRVAGLVASGLTNREVASRLFTTVATVEAHLTRIYAKLGLRSRTELARGVSDGSLAIDPELVS